MALIFKIVNFAIFIGLIFLFLRRPIKDFFATRSSSIKEFMSVAGGALEKADLESERIHARLNNLDNETIKMVRFAEEEALSDKKRLIDTANRYAEQMKKDALIFVKHETGKTIREIKMQTAEMIISDVKKGVSSKKVPTEKAVKEIDATL